MSDAALPLPDTRHRHALHEDLLAILTGTLIVALGVTFYARATLLTGSTMGLALLVQHGSGIPFAIVFTLVNLPFFWLGLRRLGGPAVLRSLAAVLLVSLFSRLTPDWVALAEVSPAYAAIIGGVLTGIGMLMLFRHRTALGGINILALWLQERFGLRAGWFQLGVDAAIMAAACFVVPPDRVALSLLGAAVLNLIIAMNHRPGRYAGVS